MNHRIHNSPWRYIGILASVSVFGFFLFWPIDTGGDFFFWGPLFDAGHYPLFFAATIVILFFCPRGISALPSWLGNPYLLAAVLAVAIEALQPLVDRDASVPDILNGLLGVAAAGVVVEMWRRPISWIARSITLVSLLLLFVVLLLPVIPAKKAVSWRSRALPKLASFTDPSEELLWAVISAKDTENVESASIELTDGESFSLQGALAVTTVSGFWAGVRYAAGDLSWADYQQLKLLVYNPSKESFPLHFRVDDNQNCKEFHQRFNSTRTLTPGVNELEFSVDDIRQAPRDRELDVSKVRRLLLFTDKKDKARRFLIDEVWLE